MKDYIHNKCKKLNSRPDTYHPRLLNPFKDVWVDADSLADSHNATAKCLFVVKRSCIPKGF
jgi:hypothetical protein